MSLPHPNITPIPNNEPDAVPSLWNTRYQEIDKNFTVLDGRQESVENELNKAKGDAPSFSEKMNKVAQDVTDQMATIARNAPNVVRANLLNTQTMAAATETVITSTPSIANCDYYTYDAASGSYAIKKQGLYQIGMHIGYTINQNGYWYDVIQYIKAYKSGITITNSNYFAGAGGWQSYGIYTGMANPQPKTFFNRLATRLDVGDKVRFLHWLTQATCTLMPESASSTQSTYVEFVYLGN